MSAGGPPLASEGILGGSGLRDGIAMGSIEHFVRGRVLKTSAAYRLFREAILTERQITCRYDGRYRELCPHIIGHTGNAEKVLAWQFGGESKGGLPPGGMWRCFTLDRVSKVQMREGPWHSGGKHKTAQTCVAEIDLDINVHVRKPR